MAANIGVEADYYSLQQTQDTYLLYDVNAAFNLGTTQTKISLGTNQTAGYKLYGLDVSSYAGFLSAGGSGNISFTTNSFGSNFQFSVDPYVGVGIGRQYSIFNILRAELMMNYLGVIPTEGKVRAVAEIFNQAGAILNRYSNNNAELAIEYWSRVAEAMGIPNRVIEVIFIANSHEKLSNYA